MSLLYSLFYQSIATPAFFPFPFAWNIFFHLFIFSLYVSFDLNWVSCRQHIPAYNHHTSFIVDDPLLLLFVFLYQWGFFFFFFLIIFLFLAMAFTFPFKEVPLNITYKASLVVMNSFGFWTSRKPYLSFTWHVNFLLKYPLIIFVYHELFLSWFF